MSEQEEPSAEEIAKQWRLTGPTGIIYTVPPHIRRSMKAYVDYHQPLGRFLTSVVSNSLKEAMMYADGENLDQLPAIVSWFFNYAPSDCWGNSARVEAWLQQRGNSDCAYHPHGHN